MKIIRINYKYFKIISCLFITFISYIFPIQLFAEEEITIQLKWWHAFQFAGYYAAKEKGYFADEGLKVSFRERSLSTNFIDDVIEGKAEYGVADAGLVLHSLQGEPVVLLAQIFQHSPLILMTLKDSGINTPYDLPGKKIMADLKGSNDAPIIAMLLKTLGTFDSVEVVPHTYSNNDLLHGKVDLMDAYLTDQPFWFKQRNALINILNPRDYGVDFYGDNFFTTKKEINNNPERVVKVLRAVKRGWKYALEHPEEMIDLILEKYNTQGLSKEHLLYEATQTRNMILPEFIPLGSYEISRYNKIVESYALLNFIDRIDLDSSFFYSDGQVSINTLDNLILPEIEEFNQINFIAKYIAMSFLLTFTILLIFWNFKGRPQQLSIRNTLVLVFFFFAGLIVSIGAFATILLESIQEQSIIETRKSKQYNLAIEFDHTSYNLTHLVTSFVATGNSQYEEYFNAILDIQNGKRAQPKYFSQYYWDFITADIITLDEDGEIYSIESRIENLEFTDKEKNLLYKVKKELENQIALETIAFNMIKGLYQDNKGFFTIKREPDTQKALQILYGSDYHLIKARLKKHIDDFFTLLEWRTTNELNLIRKENQAIVIAITSVIFITISFAIYVFLFFKQKIINPLEKLENGTEILRKGEYSHQIDINSKDEIGALAIAFNNMAQSIEEETARMRSIIESAADGIIIISSKGIINEFSPSAEKIFKYKAEEILNKNISLIIPDSDINKQNPNFTKPMDIFEAHDNGATKEVIGRKKSGSFFPMEISVAETIIKNERVFTGIVRDITERKINELEMLKLTSAVEQSPVSVIITDSEGNIEYINEHFTIVTGYLKNEVMGENPRILKSETHTDEFYEELWNTIAAGHEWKGEMQNKRKNGELYWEATSISPIFNSSNEIINYVGIKEEITERKRLEQEIITAKEKAEEATKAKSKFLANMSHEIRTPMNAVIGLTNLLLKTELNMKQSDYSSKILISAQNLLRIINDILDFSKIEAGKLEIESYDFKINDILDNLASVSSIKAFSKNLDIIISRDKKIPYYLVGDPIRVGQILLNLVNNAIKFTEKGDIIVKVELHEETNENIILKFSVKDNGIGLKEEEMKKLFKAFSQADSSTTRRFGGTGLGLKISKQLVELMKGDIWVNSEQGKGSCFEFTICFKKSNKKISELEQIPKELLNIKILIADSNNEQVDIIENYVEQFGLKYKKVNSKEQMIDILKNEDFDLIFIDNKMPNSNGIDTYIDLKENITKKTPNTILLTYFGNNEVIDKALQSGINDVLVKPINRSIIFDTIISNFGSEYAKQIRKTEKLENKPAGFQEIKGAKILLVEDNEINQQVARDSLEIEGFWVTVVSNGKEAINNIKEQMQNKEPLYDLVLMDLQMPIMDGYEASRKIRNELKITTDNLPIIALSADAMKKTVTLVKDAGMNDYLSKPLDVNKLLHVLQKWIKPGNREVNSISSKNHTNNYFHEYKYIKDLNYEKAIARLGKNHTLYNDVLKNFKNSKQNFFEDFQNSIDNNDIESAKRLVHTIKGLAGNIGAYQLQDMFLKLESLINKDETQSKEYFATLTNTRILFTDILEQIQRTFEDEPIIEISNKEIDHNLLGEKLSTLNQSLEYYNSNSKVIFNEIKDILMGSKYMQEFEKLEDFIDEYEYDEALVELERINKLLKK